jgi:iron complex transport system substrate-binding protein
MRDEKQRRQFIFSTHNANIPVLGDAELILKQAPQVIFWTDTTASEANALQTKVGIPVVVLEYGDLGPNRDVLYAGLELVGSILGRQKRAEELINFIEDTIADLDSRTADLPESARPRAYVAGVSYRGTHGIVSTEPAYEPFLFVNAKNVAGELGFEHIMIDGEQLLKWDPDVIFVDEGGWALVLEDLEKPEYASLSAVSDGELYGVLPFNHYTCNFATVLADAYFIGSVLYPDRFSDVVPEEMADRIYQKFVGAPVYGQMKELFGGFKKVRPDGH